MNQTPTRENNVIIGDVENNHVLGKLESESELLWATWAKRGKARTILKLPKRVQYALSIVDFWSSVIETQAHLRATGPAEEDRSEVESEYGSRGKPSFEVCTSR